ncbi:MAG: asparagine--tRNA ligase [Desulfovibrio sp.]|nr:asparagine--tRNA ligase [Desulfovibrio sp.]
MHTLIAEAKNCTEPKEDIQIKGWIRTRRDAKGFSFLEINDGSCLAGMQCIVDTGTEAHDALADANTGSSVSIQGKLVASPGNKQKWEIQVQKLVILGEAKQENYPLQKKRHSDEFLRSIAHLRARTNKYGAMFRLRSEAAFAIHTFFHERHFTYVHTPILTGSDCEGAGELFRVTTLPPNAPRNAHDFFSKQCNLTVSGQLEAETLACALGRVYTFGPTFRAENSNTPRHAAEFWMVEPEVAFSDLNDIMRLSEEFVQTIIQSLFKSSLDDLTLFDSYVEKGLLKRLEKFATTPFAKLPYAECIELLKKSKEKFVYPPEFGIDLATEHERFLTEEIQGPIIVYDYPKAIKSFYMRDNTDQTTVAAMDVLMPGIGEIIGGSQREERFDVLMQKMQQLNLNAENYWWYTDLRKFGTVPHAGFGLGFERLLMLVTGVNNIRDCIPFPRTPGSLEF